MEKWSTTVLGILTLSVLAAAIWDGIKVIARVAWMHRTVMVAGLRRAPSLLRHRSCAEWSQG